MIADIQILDELLFKPSELELSNVQPEIESKDYFAHTLQLNKHVVKFRSAKITPTKKGQFVTLWKRDERDTTVPHSIKDAFEFYIITTRLADFFGVFLFPKTVLHEHHVLSDDRRDGKRGFRVYPDWDNPTSKQAQHTQLWQLNHFVNLSELQPHNFQNTKSIRLLLK